MPNYKRPVSVLVLVHTSAMEFLILERARHQNFWQSVTGSQEENESLQQCALREVQEETGLRVRSEQLHDWRLTNRFSILPLWQARYGPGITHNTEHVFSLCLEAPTPPVLSPQEHRHWLWLPAMEAAQKVFSWSNRDGILMLAGQRTSR